MANFALVHGAWHGGWCWVRVAGYLISAGHKVLTPTLGTAPNWATAIQISIPT